MLKIHFIMAILSAWRLTELFSLQQVSPTEYRAVDKIFAPILLFAARWIWIRELLTCTRCLSVWTGIVSTVLFVYYPKANWPLAISILYSMAGRIMESLPRPR